MNNMVVVTNTVGYLRIDGVDVRKTAGTPTRVSVHDLISAITGQSKNKRAILCRLKHAYPEICSLLIDYKFPGRGNQVVPTVDARGVVAIINLLPGRRATEFRAVSADIVVHYLDSAHAAPDNIASMLGHAVVADTDGGTSVAAADAGTHSTFGEHAPPFEVKSATGIINTHAGQVYTRTTPGGKFKDVYPIGRPHQKLTAEQLHSCVIIKFGMMGEGSCRDRTHRHRFGGESKLLDSCVTKAYAFVEQRCKDVWKNDGQLYEGVYEGRTERDTELLMCRTQEEYNEAVRFINQVAGLYEGRTERDTELLMCRTQDEYNEAVRFINQVAEEAASGNNPDLELKIAQEHTKRIEIEAGVRKIEIEAGVRKLEIEAGVRKLEIEAGVRKLEIEANASVRKLEMMHMA
jgi:pterin-4a-carbinolamine dehydratase